MKRLVTILFVLFLGFALDGVAVVSNDATEVSSAFVGVDNAELSADVIAQIQCARTYNSDLKLPSTPSVTAPQQVEQTLRNDNGSVRRVICSSVVRSAGAGRVYISTKPLSRLFVGGAASDFAIQMLCRLII